MMKFEKNNHYFSIAVYVFLTTLSVVIVTALLLKLNIVWQMVLDGIGMIYILLEPLIIGLVIAYLLDPIVIFYDKRWHQATFHFKFHLAQQPHLKEVKEKRWHTRTMPTLLTFLTLLAVMGLFVLLIQMNLEQVSSVFSISDLKESLAGYLAYFEEVVLQYTSLLEDMGMFQVGPRLIERLYTIVNQFVIHLYMQLLNSLSTLGMHTMNVLLALVITFYLLQDKARFLSISQKICKRLFSKHYALLKRLAHDVDAVLSGYIRGEMLDAIIMTIATSLALMLIQLDFAIVIGIISGIFNLIPYFGPIVGFGLAVIIGLLDPNPMKAIYGAIAIIIIQQIDGWIIVPNLIGDRVKLHPIIVLLAILIGGNLFGLIGMILAVPVAALIRLILTYFVTEFIDDNK